MVRIWFNKLHLLFAPSMNSAFIFIIRCKNSTYSAFRLVKSLHCWVQTIFMQQTTNRNTSSITSMLLESTVPVKPSCLSNPLSAPKLFFVYKSKRSLLTKELSYIIIHISFDLLKTAILIRIKISFDSITPLSTFISDHNFVNLRQLLNCLEIERSKLCTASNTTDLYI